jgi:GH35 family endo-1,4-beta-xylanase
MDAEQRMGMNSDPIIINIYWNSDYMGEVEITKTPYSQADVEKLAQDFLPKGSKVGGIQFVAHKFIRFSSVE